MNLKDAQDIYNLKIRKVLDEKGLFEEPTIKNLQRKSEILNKHIKTHSHDQVGKRSQTITKAHLKKRQDHLKRK